ncbi:MAG: hypothetical protein AAF135_14785, partial [Bacteroidota bacterium]
VIYYPAGSTYTIIDENNRPVNPEAAEANTFVYKGEIRLKVFPSYRPSPDRYPLKNQEITIMTTISAAKEAGFADGVYTPSNPTAKEHEAIPQRPSTHVKIQKELIPSQARPGKYNVKLTFSNGIEFMYQDGQAQAFYRGEEQVIDGKYLVLTPLGIAKISFDPGSGVVWWVFEPAAEE